MHRFKFLLGRIFDMDYKNMVVIARKVSKKAKKSFFITLVDIIRCGIKYQAGYYDYQEFEFYNLDAKQRKTYLTRGKNNEIVRVFNDLSKAHIFNNKDEFNTVFKDFIKRDWIKLDGDNQEEFIDFFEKNQVIIVKPLNGEGGESVFKATYKSRENAKELYARFMANNQNLAEECIVQNRELDKLYGDSVNSLRVFSFYENGNVHILQTVLKIGNGGIIDNFSGGGMYTFVDENGKVYAGAIDKDDNVFFEHPITKAKILGFEVPLYDKVKKMIDKAARVVPEIAYIGWDVAVGEDEASIIEGNSFPGVFQVKPSLAKEKVGLLPQYDEVMHIFGLTG